MTPTAQKPNRHFSRVYWRAGRPTACVLGRAPTRLAERTR
jgi:hypothetical protein